MWQSSKSLVETSDLLMMLLPLWSVVEVELMLVFQLSMSTSHKCVERVQTLFS